MIHKDLPHDSRQVLSIVFAGLLVKQSHKLLSQYWRGHRSISEQSMKSHPVKTGIYNLVEYVRRNSLHFRVPE